MNTLNETNLRISNKEKAIIAFNELTKYFDVELSNSTLVRTKYSLSVFLQVPKKTVGERDKFLKDIERIREFCKELGFKPFEFDFNQKWRETDENGLWCECFDLI